MRGRFGKYGEIKRRGRLRKRRIMRARNLTKLEKRFKIAPGHPNMGRR